MRTLKSFWFWFLVVWLVAGIVAVAVVASRAAAWTWIHTSVAVAWFVAGILIGLYLRQRALVKLLSKGAQAESNDRFDEVWKSGFAADARKLLEGDGSRSGAVSRRRLLWVVSVDFEASRRLLLAGGAVDATDAIRHELSGEFQVLGNVLRRKDEFLLLLKELPDPRVPATVGRADFLLEILSQKGKLRPVDAVVVLSPLQSEALPPAIQAAVAHLAQASGVEFPVHLGLHGAETLSGGEDFFRACPEPPGVVLPWSRQEELPRMLEQGWARLEADLDGKEAGHLASAWDRSLSPASAWRFLDDVRRAREGVRSAALSASSQFTRKPHPFLRGVYLLPSDGLRRKVQGRAAQEAPSGPLLFGSGMFLDSSNQAPGAPAPEIQAAEPETAIAALERFLELLHDEPELARLGAGRQARASILSLTIFVVTGLLSILLLWSALHGWAKGSALERDWTTRLARDNAVPWADPSSIREGVAALDDADRLVDEIDNGRPWLLAPGFYRGSRNLPAARALLDTMAHRLVRGADQAEEARLRTLAMGRMEDTKDLYNSLKTYLLCTRQGWVEGESKEGKKGLAEAFVRSWTEYLGYATLPAFERAVLPRVAQRISERVADGDSSWLSSADLNLVASARGQLRSVKNQSGTYARLVAAADTLPKLDWDSLGIPQKDMDCRPLEIPAAYTRRGWLQAVQPAFQAMTEGEVDWVVGEGEQDPSRNGAEVFEELKRRYVEEFTKAWQAVLDTGTCAIPAENQRVGSVLAYLSSPYNAQNPRGVLAFFHRIQDETDLSPAKDTSKSVLPAAAQGALNQAKKAAAAVAKFTSQSEPVEVQVARNLASLRGLATDAGKGALDSYVKDLAALGALFSQWSGPDGAFQFAKGVSTQDARNPLVHAWNEAAARRDVLPADLRPWFQAFTWGTLRQVGARAYPQAQAQAQAWYREKVLLPWQNLSKGAYPFDPYAENEAGINDIDGLLNPRSGSLAAFLKDLDGLVTAQNGEFKAVSFNGLALTTDPSAADQVRRLLKIADFFYGKGGSSWKGVNATISVRADSRARATLRAGTQTLDIPQGTERKLSLRWPVPGQGGVSIQVATVNQTFEEKRDGDWALLRLMDSKAPGSSEATWSFNDRSYIVDVPVSVRLDQPGGPFQDRDFFRVALLPELFR
jgi:type VI protein secretion system component VasK